MLEDVLFVVVSCTKDRSRLNALKKLIRSLNRENKKIDLSGNFIFFDNASDDLSPLKDVSFKTHFALSSENIGYWSALNWIILNAEEILGRKFSFIHPIESDLVLYNLESLAEAREFLLKNPDKTSVRTQEFSIKHKNRYIKNARSLWPVRRSRVAGFNGVTNEVVSFVKVDGFRRIYKCDWHSKVPALHNFQHFKEVFLELSKKNHVSEHEFMIKMHEISPEVGILDKGIFYTTMNVTLNWPWQKKWVTGSWADSEKLKEIGYMPTRNSVISSVFPKIQVTDSINPISKV